MASLPRRVASLHSSGWVYSGRLQYPAPFGSDRDSADWNDPCLFRLEVIEMKLPEITPVEPTIHDATVTDSLLLPATMLDQVERPTVPAAPGRIALFHPASGPFAPCPAPVRVLSQIRSRVGVVRALFLD